jgi:hypothetical protein
MAAVAAATIGGALAPGGANGDTLTFDETFASTGDEQFLSIPAGVRFAQVTLVGGSGANTTNNGGLSAAGGRGASVEGLLEVADGEGRTLYLEVGGNGQANFDNNNNPGGFNGGGAGLATGTANGGFNAGGGGGGASDIRTIPRGADGSLGSRLVIAGGGGGSGKPLNGSSAASAAGGAGGNAGTTGNGIAGGTSPFGAGGGGGGTSSAGGAAGGGIGTTGTAGAAGQGGNGGNPGQNAPSGGGGGGGGGLFGGGGGRGGFTSSFGGGGGGGGGSSLVPAGFSVEIPSSPTAPSIRVAYTRPDTTIDAGPDEFTSDPMPTFDFTSSEPGATFTCSLAGSTVPCASGYSPAAPLADGEYTFEVFATNTVGNFDPEPATREFRVDTVAPTATITSGPSGVTSERSPVFGIDVDEQSATLRCGVDGQLTNCARGEITVGPLAEGPHVFEVIATDAAGNQGPAATRNFSVEPPVAVLTLGKPKRDKKRGTAELPADVSGPGLLTLTGGAKIKAVESPVQAAGSSVLPVKAIGKGRKRLRKKGKLKVAVTVRFTPEWGDTVERTAKLTLKKKRKRR